MKSNYQHHCHQMSRLFLLFLPLASLSPPATSIEFLCNSFNSTDLLLYGTAKIDTGIIRLTNDTTLTMGRALYPSKVRTKAPNGDVYPFSTSFVFAMVPYKDKAAGHGLVLLFVPFTGIQGALPAQFLGLFNGTNNGLASNHVLGVEFDVVANEEFKDINSNHVAIDVNSPISISSEDAGYWVEGGGSKSRSQDSKSFKELKLNNGRNYQVWIDYNDSLLNVTMAPAGLKRPSRPLLSVPLNLSSVFEEEMYVGFTASTGMLVESHKILSWSFSNSDFSLSDTLITTGLPSFVHPTDSLFQSTFKSKRYIPIVAIGGFLAIGFVILASFLLLRMRRRLRERAGL